MMRFLRWTIYNERNSKLSSKDVYEDFATIQCMELCIRQPAALAYNPIATIDDDFQNKKNVGAKTSRLLDIANGGKKLENQR